MNEEDLQRLRGEEAARAARSTWPAIRNLAVSFELALNEIDRLRPIVLALARDVDAYVGDDGGRRCRFCGVIGQKQGDVHRPDCVKALADAFAQAQLG